MKANVIYSTYQDLYEESLGNRERFWREEAKELVWEKFPEKIWDGSGWFADGTTNITLSCLDRHAQSDRVAFYYEGRLSGEQGSITYKELLVQVERFADVLLSFGLKQMDRVVIYMPMLVETAVAMLACARVGLVHSVVFGGFSA